LPAFDSVIENQEVFVSEILYVFLPTFSELDETDTVTLQVNLQTASLFSEVSSGKIMVAPLDASAVGIHTI